MCQLTYCNLHDKTLNALLIYELGVIGSIRHDDGTGFMCSNGTVWKTKLAAKLITNLGNIFFKNIKDNKPVPFHIRSATNGVEVTDENAHPFIGKHYILEHNGTLLKKGAAIVHGAKKDSDSELFLKALDEAKDKNPKDSFDKIFNKAMENFTGKFAFLIRSRNNVTDYIVRGKTAELWISYLMLNDKKVGYVINTSKETINDAIHHFVNIAAIYSGIEYKFTEPVLLEQESIFIAKENEIELLAKTKENEKVVEVIQRGTEIIPHTRSMVEKRFNELTRGELCLDIVPFAEKIENFLYEHRLGVLDLQIIFQVLSGISLLEVNKEDIAVFVEYLIPKLSASGKTRKRVAEVLGARTFPHELYKKHNFEYPWMLNEPTKVLDALKQYMKVQG